MSSRFRACCKCVLMRVLLPLVQCLTHANYWGLVKVHCNESRFNSLLIGICFKGLSAHVNCCCNPYELLNTRLGAISLSRLLS